MKMKKKKGKNLTFNQGRKDVNGITEIKTL